MISRNMYLISIVIVAILVFVLFSGSKNEQHHQGRDSNTEEAFREQRERSAMSSGQPSTGQVFSPGGPLIPPSSNVYPPNGNINQQYSNPYLTSDKHPVLAYQYSHDKGINPANIGDPIRTPMIGGGASGLYGGSYRGGLSFSESLLFSHGSIPTGLGPKGRDEDSYVADVPRQLGYAGPGNSRREGYEREFTDGPYPGRPIGVPVPANALKRSNERYNPDMFRFSPLATGTIGSALSGPGDYFRPYGPNVPVNPVPFIGSVNAYAPFPEVNSFAWEKSGILTSNDAGKKQILNLYRRPIAPLQDLWEYQVQDKNGFVIKLQEKYLEDGDIVPHVDGYEGPWKVHDYVQNKYIWV